MDYSKDRICYDTTFELNEFNEPRIRSEAETLKDVLMFVLFSKPGQYPSLPLIGMDIQSRLYSFFDEINVEDLKTELVSQCQMLDVYLNDNTIQLLKTMYKGQPSLLINISATESYPENYMRDHTRSSSEYLIGITYDELNRMVYNINSRR